MWDEICSALLRLGSIAVSDAHGGLVALLRMGTKNSTRRL